MKKKILIFLIVAALAGGVFISFSGATKNKKHEIKDVIVKPVKKGDLIESISAEGSVEITNEQDIYVSKKIRVDKVFFEEDDVVKKGDILISFDSEERNDLIRQIEGYKLKIEEEKLNIKEYEFKVSKIDIEQAKRNAEELEVSIRKYKENIKVAETEKSVIKKNYENSLKEYEVNKKLFDIEGISLSDLNSYEETKNELQKDLESKEWDIKEYKMDLEEAKKNLELANKTLKNEEKEYEEDLIKQKNNIEKSKLAIKEYELEMESLKEDLDKTVEYVKSPVDGTITEITAEENFLVNVEESLMTISDMNSQVIKAKVSSYDINKVKLGQKVKITCDALPKNKVLYGKVSQISSLATTDEGNGYEDVVVEVKIKFDTKNSGLKPGYDVNVEIITGTKEDVVTVPTFAVNNEKGRSYVVILNNNGTVSKKFVKTGVKTSQIVEVLDLKSGEKIIMNGIGLKDGEKVHVVDKIMSNIAPKKNDRSGRKPRPGGPSM